jgi:hypothetical protein
MSSPVIEIHTDPLNPHHITFIVGDPTLIPTSELSDEDTWNVPWEPDYTDYELIHWTSLTKPEEMFEVHWAYI